MAPDLVEDLRLKMERLKLQDDDVDDVDTGFMPQETWQYHETVGEVSAKWVWDQHADGWWWWFDPASRRWWMG